MSIQPLAGRSIRNKPLIERRENFCYVNLFVDTRYIGSLDLLYTLAVSLSLFIGTIAKPV